MLSEKTRMAITDVIQIGRVVVCGLFLLLALLETITLVYSIFAFENYQGWRSLLPPLRFSPWIPNIPQSLLLAALLWMLGNGILYLLWEKR